LIGGRCTVAIECRTHAIRIHTLFRQAFNRGDVEALAAMYEPDAVFLVDGREVTGSDRVGDSRDEH